MICPKCGAQHERKQMYCKSCFAAYMRAYRKRRKLGTLPRFSRKERKLKANARSIANHYRKIGVLVAKPCHCGSTNVEMHHPDYSRPLEVEWLCRRDHWARHVELNNELLTRNEEVVLWESPTQPG